MGKASRTKRAGTTREKIAAQRAAARRTEMRNRVLLASGAVVVVIAIVVAFVLVKANSNGKSNSSSSNGPTGTALTAVVNKVTTVPASTLDAVGAGSVTAGPTAVSGTSLTANGKPEVLYIGAEYCPYCAAQRWAMVVALSRFGTFSGLSTVHSASRDVYPNTPTFTFHGSHYTSKYLSFAPVEETTNVPNGNSYTLLDKPTAAQQALATKYDKQGSIPFIDFGNKYVEVGNLAGYGPQDLSGKSWSQIATALSDPSSPIAKAVDGSANYTTATICKLTNNQPASACTSAIKALEAKA
jgi:hypothetical protein